MEIELAQINGVIVKRFSNERIAEGDDKLLPENVDAELITLKVVGIVETGTNDGKMSVALAGQHFDSGKYYVIQMSQMMFENIMKNFEKMREKWEK